MAAVDAGLGCQSNPAASSSAPYFSQRLYHIPYDLKKIIALILVGFGLSSLMYFTQPYAEGYNLWAVIGVKLLILSIFGGYIVYKNLLIIKSFINRGNGH